MQDNSSLDDAVALMRDLRARCDWDAAQSHDSLRPYLIEEAFELDDAIRSGNDALMREELGDVLLQILFHSVIAEERGAFSFADVAAGFVTKMKGRHPHLYGDGVKEPWERMKAKTRQSITDGLPVDLPALHRAFRLQERAAAHGFDWSDVAGPLAKVIEETEEVREALVEHPPQIATSGASVLDEAHAAIEEELGDLIFACVNLCRRSGVHPALALDRANGKFAGRWAKMEIMAAARGLDMKTAGLRALDGLWDEAKAAEREE